MFVLLSAGTTLVVKEEARWLEMADFSPEGKCRQRKLSCHITAEERLWFWQAERQRGAADITVCHHQHFLAHQLATDNIPPRPDVLLELLVQPLGLMDETVN
ncbi:hypothetical protein Q7C36_008116 [Tachysurus vachellii]|uniref:Uncharacterized protein n=1 Tax=Tachysurus vachellii TaxID=175792 RepID=A0AA88SXZ8_TACVA|nr:hypothetical protein Q7C36_008116 [Tachysurus vachellii]